MQGGDIPADSSVSQSFGFLPFSAHDHFHRCNKKKSHSIMMRMYCDDVVFSEIKPTHSD